MRNSLLWGIAITALIIAGCVSTPGPVNQTNNTSAIMPPIRYVELGMIDGSRIGGEYVSESANFITVIPLYVFEEDSDRLINGSGIEMGIKITLVNTMTNITDPHPFIIAKLKSQNEKVAAEERAYQAQQEEYRLAKEKREAEAAKYAGKPPS